jgi:hypothetical protein
MAPVQDLDKKEPDCPCCGARMDLFTTGFGTKIKINGLDYFCNNPACYCQTPQNQKLEKE